MPEVFFTPKFTDKPGTVIVCRQLRDDDQHLLPFPEYILIKPGTKIEAAPAPAPDGNLDALVAKLTQQN